MAEADKKNKAKQKTSSIARKINSDFFFRSLAAIGLLDFIVIIIAIGFFFINCHKQLPDSIFEDKERWLSISGAADVDFDVDTRDGREEVIYSVKLEDGEVYEFYVREYIEIVNPVIFALLIGELIWFATGFYKTRQIRKRMRPLYEIALQADAVSKLASGVVDKRMLTEDGKVGSEAMDGAALSEGNMRHLESAINKADPNSPFISTGDKELQGIEIALNNLLNEMQESRKQQVRFVSDASHELRTPIAVIQGYVNMLDRWGKQDEQILEESIEALKNESEHMKELVEQLLFLARGDSGRNNLQRRDFDLSKVIFEVWEESIMIDESHRYKFYLEGEEVNDLEEYFGETDLFSAQYMEEGADGTEPGGEDEHGLIINGNRSYDGSSDKEFNKESLDEIITNDRKAEREKYMINGDLAMIKQSARIFLQNAAKYSDKKSEIKIQVKTGNEGSVSYVIQDEGIGLTQDQLDHIFERFYRSDEARNADTGGTGLGLSIAKWIIDAHEAKVDVLSRVGVGTRFTVSFKPLKDVEKLDEAS